MILSVVLLQGDGGGPLVCELVNLAASDDPKCSTVCREMVVGRWYVS